MCSGSAGVRRATRRRLPLQQERKKGLRETEIAMGSLPDLTAEQRQHIYEEERMRLAVPPPPMPPPPALSPPPPPPWTPAPPMPQNTATPFTATVQASSTLT